MIYKCEEKKVHEAANHSHRGIQLVEPYLRNKSYCVLLRRTLYKPPLVFLCTCTPSASPQSLASTPAPTQGECLVTARRKGVATPQLHCRAAARLPSHFLTFLRVCLTSRAVRLHWNGRGQGVGGYLLAGTITPLQCDC